MKIIFRMTLLALLFTSFISTAWADEFEETKKMFSDAGISEMFTSAYGYALFPTIGKAGFVVGGALGKGRVFEQHNYIGDVLMGQATVGFQIGASGFSQVIFFEDQRALQEFTSGNFEFGAEVSAVALTAAAGATASTSGSSATASGGKNNATAKGPGYNKGMATYTITKGGAMVEASVGGQNFKFTKVAE
ncbi:lipid-binding SYLF domain-containing protein [Desulforhopalus sp. 52FAK]